MMDERDSTESALLITLDEIDAKLDSIRDTKGYLVIGPGSNSDVLPSKKEQILNNINMLNNIISDNDKKIKALESALKQLNSNNKALINKLALYGRRNEDFLTEINSLRLQVNEERIKNEEEKENSVYLTKQLNEQNISYRELKKRFDRAESDAYTAYYIYGTKKQLRELKVLEKKKLPFVNIGYSGKSVSYFPSGEFERVDSREDAIIPLHAKNVTLVTPHSKESYILKDDDEGLKNLFITNPEMFWQSSRYLVVEVK